MKGRSGRRVRGFRDRDESGDRLYSCKPVFGPITLTSVVERLGRRTVSELDLSTRTYLRIPDRDGVESGYGTEIRGSTRSDVVMTFQRTSVEH